MAIDTHDPAGLDTLRERQIEQILRTGTTDGVTMRGFPVVLMTFRGVRSGAFHVTPLMRVEHDGRYVVVASNGGASTNPAWYASLIGEPVVELQDGAITRQYVAHEVFGDDKDRWWRRAVDAYPPFADYQRGTERQIPVFVLAPVDEDDLSFRAA